MRCFVSGLLGVFLAIVAGMFALVPDAGAERLIGVIMSGNTPYYQDIHASFEKQLAAEGIEGQIVVQRPGTDAMAWRNAARKLVAIESDVIVTYGAPATLTAAEETGKIPVVFAGVFDPDGLGIQGGNVTGIASGVPISGVIKHLGTITRFKKLGVIFNEDERDTVLQLDEIRGIGGKQGFEVFPFDVKTASTPDPLSGTDALFLTTSCAAMHCVQNFVGVARQNRIPTASATGGGEQSGIVLTVAADAGEQGAAVAQMVGRVLGGEKPSSIPIERPKKVNLILNVKEARSIGLKIPFSVMTSATQVIQ